jgi:hypothetical protein
MKRTKRRRRILWVVMGLLALLVVAGFLADRQLKHMGHPGLGRFARQVAVNYPNSFKVEPPVLEMRVREKDLEQLQQVVEDARARGVILPEGNQYITAEISHQGETFKARIRIKGKLTDHVKGRKWSFRVIAKKDGGFLGMRRFSLQHPGTRNYLYDWFYHRLMAGEGVIALRYGFLRLKFNDEDLGIYAYEEHFGPELLEHNERLPGPLFRFDPGLYWEHRLNEMRKLKLDEPYAAYQAATLDAFGSKEMAKDPRMLRQFEEAVAAMDGFRRGTLNASQVFDTDKIARRHAILDLIGGHHSMDFSDVKFYYDPVEQRIEPVAYESFSAFPIRTLAGSHRYTGRRSPSQDLHDAYFNDPQLFRQYVRHLERVSSEAYLDSVFAALGPALDSAAAVVYQEFPWKEMDRSIFRRNQQVIRRLLDVPKGFHAHAQGWRGDTLELLAVPVEGLPLEVHALQLGDGTAIPPIQPVIVPCRMPGKLGDPISLKFLVPRQKGAPPAMHLTYAVLGASRQRSLEVFPYALLEWAGGVGAVDEGRFRKEPFLLVDEEARTVHFRHGRWAMEEDLLIPAGYTVHGSAPLELTLNNGARLILRSPLTLNGVPEDPVRIRSVSGGSIMLLDPQGPSAWSHVEIDLNGPRAEPRAAITAQNAVLRLQDCRIGGDPSRDLLHLVRANLHMTASQLATGRDLLNASHSQLRLEQVDMQGAADDALVLHGGKAVLQRMNIVNCRGTGLKADLRADVQVSTMTMRQVGRGLDVGGGSTVKWEGGRISTEGIAVVVEERKQRMGPSQVEVRAVKLEAPTPAQVGAGNTVNIEGVKTSEKADT